ncbi:MAG: DUF5615 family PIN-like protein [Candidatus Edwardsbacteria bacterium]
MLLKILADENVDYRIINELVDRGFEVISVLKNYKGASDKEVLELARKENTLLLTEDSDFGEWIFAYGERNVGVIFLRYKSEEMENTCRSVVRVLFEYGSSLYGKFVVISESKIRVREIPYYE